MKKNKYNISIIGTGFVGLVSSAVFAHLGHNVLGIDIDEKKIQSIKKGKVPFFEPKLEDLLKQGLKNKNLDFTTDFSKIKDSDIIIISVGTPKGKDGHVDLSFVFSAFESILPFAKKDAIVAIKSTVPPDTISKIKQKFNKQIQEKNLHLVYLPEFLKEGSAVDDTLFPDRIVIGSNDKYAIDILKDLHKPLSKNILVVKPESSQLIKYTANSYLALRITYINEIADICEKVGADIQEVIKGIGYDKRIGHHYWYPGLGYGGSCFPKDVKELALLSKDIGLKNNIIQKIDEINSKRIDKIIKKIERIIGSFENKTIAILGLSFKPNTNDTREAPAVHIIPKLLDKKAKIKAYDPMAHIDIKDNNYTQKQSIEKTIENADIIFILIEWPEIINYNFPYTNKKVIFFDSRNQFNKQDIEKKGYKYIGIGR